ncbi:MAG: hypothetical protein IPN42_17485 [Methylococcaceae bacterium]|nr:hypothetical protein [Methylococcaceae bacterium]
MTIKSFPSLFKSLAILAGLFYVLSILGCQSEKSPEEVTKQFWQTLAQGRIENAKDFVTTSSQHLVNLQDIDQHSTIQIGEAVIEESNAMVQTTLMRHKKQVTFDTALSLEQDAWKVDYLQTQMNISMLPLEDVVKSLQNLGGVFAKQLEKQLPLIQKEMESLGDELKNQIDEFGRSLEKPQNPNTNTNTKKPTPGSI